MRQSTLLLENSLQEKYQLAISAQGYPDEVGPIKDLWGALHYTNEELVKRFARRQKVSISESTHLFEECKKMLIVMGMVRASICPSKKLDEMWHHFILHTKDYQFFCDNFIGKFIHHDPTETPFLGSRPTMAKLACDLFSQIDTTIWPTTESVACSSGGTDGDDYCSSGSG